MNRKSNDDSHQLLRIVGIRTRLGGDVDEVNGKLDSRHRDLRNLVENSICRIPVSFLVEDVLQKELQDESEHQKTTNLKRSKETKIRLRQSLMLTR